MLRTLTLGLLATILLMGCGFQLRGTGFDSLAGSKVQLVIEQPWSPLARELRQSFARYEVDVDVVSALSESEFGIKIDRVVEQREVISVDADGRPAEYDNRLLAIVLFQPKDKPVVQEQIRVQRDYRFDKNNSLAFDRELRIQTEQMTAQLARRITRQMLELMEKPASEKSE